MTSRTAIVCASALACAVTASLANSGCSPSDSDAGVGGRTNCPNDLPDACPSPKPSYASEVSTIISTKCATQCHSPTGENQAPTLVTYADIYSSRSAILDQVYHCLMPNVGSTSALTADERAALLGWLVCESPDN